MSQLGEVIIENKVIIVNFFGGSSKVVIISQMFNYGVREGVCVASN